MNSLSLLDKELIEACKNNKSEEALKALKNGANGSVLFRQTLEEVTPLILASTKGYIDIIKILLTTPNITNPDINARSSFGYTTALLRAVSHDHIDCVQFLINSGADVNQSDKLGRTPLMDAVENGNKEMVELLIKSGANVNSTDKEERTALSYCLDFVDKEDNRYFDIAYLLICEHHCDANKTGVATKRTFLHCCAARGDLNLCKKLVEELKINITLEDSLGYTAVDYAKLAGHVTLLQYFHSLSDTSCHIL